MDNQAGIVLILWAAVCKIGTAGLIVAFFRGGHVGDDLVLYCGIRNHGGVAEFYRRVGDNKEIINPATSSLKYGVYRLNKTDSDVRGEDSVLTISEASESDNGIYGCVLNVNGKLDWDVIDETNVTVQPAYANPTGPLSLTTNENKVHEQEKQARTDGVLPQSPQPTNLPAVIVIPSLAVALLIALVALYYEKRRNRHRETNHARNGEDVDLNGTCTSGV